MKPFRIRERIALPFILVTLLTTAGAGLASLSFISKTLTERVDAQIIRGSRLVSRSDFAINPTILRLAGEVTEAHLVTFDKGGIVARNEGDADDGLAQVLASHDAVDELARTGNDILIRRISHEGVDYAVAYRPVAAREGTYIAFATNTSRATAAGGAAQRTVLAVAGVSFLALVLLSYVVSRRVSRPIEAELVRAEKLGVAGLIAARVAHDIRNPLSSIKMQTQLLRSRLRGDTDNQALLSAVLADIGQVEIVVKGLLEIARPGELRCFRTHLNDVVRDVLRQVEPQMTHRKIRIEEALGDGLGDVLLDIERFKLALLNVVTNAADAMPSGGLLEVATRAEGSTVQLDVCDDGVGIDPRVAGRLFDPFVSTKPDGIGLGLVNTKATIDSHGGSVTLTGRDGRGTCVRIVLPSA